MKNRILLFVLASCTLIVTGFKCGGGQTFEVLGTTPDPDEINVLLDQSVEVTFNHAIKSDTATTSNFYVKDADGNIVDGTVSLSIPPPDPSLTMIFTPANPWTEGTEYTATITTGLVGIVGRYAEEMSLDEDYSWNFTTRKWFDVGSAVSSETSAAEDPVMMLVDAAPSVGYRFNGYEMNLQFWDGSEWSPTETDPTGGMAESFYGAPGFCTDGTNVYMAYSAYSNYNKVFAYRWDPTNKWQAMNNGNKISIGTQYSATEATVACGSDPFVGWIETNTSTEAEDAYVADVTMVSSSPSPGLSRNDNPGDYWSSVKIVGVMTDGTDAYLSTWENDPVDPYRLDLYVTKWDGANFTNLGGIVASDFGGSNLGSAPMAMSGTDLYIAYAAAPDSDGVKQVYVKKFNGTDWETMGNAIAAYTGEEHVDSSYPDLIMAGNTLYVAWEENWGIFAAYWDAASSEWMLNNQNRVINQNVGSDASDPSLAYSAADDILYIAFLVNKTGGYQVFVMKRNMQ